MNKIVEEFLNNILKSTNCRIAYEYVDDDDNFLILINRNNKNKAIAIIYHDGKIGFIPTSHCRRHLENNVDAIINDVKITANKKLMSLSKLCGLPGIINIADPNCKTKLIIAIKRFFMKK